MLPPSSDKTIAMDNKHNVQLTEYVPNSSYSILLFARMLLMYTFTAIHYDNMHIVGKHTWSALGWWNE